MHITCFGLLSYNVPVSTDHKMALFLLSMLFQNDIYFGTECVESTSYLDLQHVYNEWIQIRTACMRGEHNFTQCHPKTTCSAYMNIVLYMTLEVN